MTYYADLAAALRARKCTEEQTLDALRTVREATTASGTTPDEEFGAASKYAENFSGSRKLTTRQLVRGVSTVASILVLGVLRLVVLRDSSLGWRIVQAVLVFAVIGMVGELVGRWVSRRIPRLFHESASE